MTLRVEFEEFVEESVRRFGKCEAYVTAAAVGTLITAASPSDSTVLACVTTAEMDWVEEQLKSRGAEVRRGAWQTEGGFVPYHDLHIGIVSFRSHESSPGIWVDADLHPISEAILVERFEAEMRTEMNLNPDQLETALKQAHPRVLLLRSRDLERYAQQNTRKRQNEEVHQASEEPSEA